MTQTGLGWNQTWLTQVTDGCEPRLLHNITVGKRKAILHSNCALQLTNFTTSEIISLSPPAFLDNTCIINFYHKQTIHTWSPVPAKWTHTGRFLLSGQTFGRIIWKLKSNRTSENLAFYTSLKHAKLSFSVNWFTFYGLTVAHTELSSLSCQQQVQSIKALNEFKANDSSSPDEKFQICTRISYKKLRSTSHNKLNIRNTASDHSDCNKAVTMLLMTNENRQINNLFAPSKSLFNLLNESAYFQYWIGLSRV